MRMNESVAIIILNYNDDKDTIECIYSLLKLPILKMGFVP